MVPGYFLVLRLALDAFELEQVVRGRDGMGRGLREASGMGQPDPAGPGTPGAPAGRGRYGPSG